MLKPLSDFLPRYELESTRVAQQHKSIEIEMTTRKMEIAKLRAKMDKAGATLDEAARKRDSAKTEGKAEAVVEKAERDMEVKKSRLDAACHAYQDAVEQMNTFEASSDVQRAQLLEQAESVEKDRTVIVQTVYLALLNLVGKANLEAQEMPRAPLAAAQAIQANADLEAFVLENQSGLPKEPHVVYTQFDSKFREAKRGSSGSLTSLDSPRTPRGVGSQNSLPDIPALVHRSSLGLVAHTVSHQRRSGDFSAAPPHPETEQQPPNDPHDMSGFEADDLGVLHKPPAISISTVNGMICAFIFGFSFDFGSFFPHYCFFIES